VCICTFILLYLPSLSFLFLFLPFCLLSQLQSVSGPPFSSVFYVLIGRKKSSLLQENSERFPYYRKPSMFKHHCLKHTKQTKHPFKIPVLQPVQAFFKKHPFRYPPRCILNICLEICLESCASWFKRNRPRQRPTSRLMIRTDCRD
jgi:hypothetical protein